MLIGEVAARSGVAAKTLRYYEHVGLLELPTRGSSGYRNYDEDVLDRLTFIRSAQAIGLSLGEIRSVIALRENGETPCGHVLALLRRRGAEIDKTIRELRTLKAELARLIDRSADLDPDDCDAAKVCHLIGPAPTTGRRVG